MYRIWAKGWLGEEGSWWRFTVTLLSFFVPLLAVNLAAAVLVNSFHETFVKLAQREKDAVQALILFAMFVPALAIFLLVKRRVSPGRPSVLAAPGTRFDVKDALVSFGILLVLLTAADWIVGGTNPVTKFLGNESLRVWLVPMLVLLLTIAIQASSEEIVVRGYVAPRCAAWSNTPIAALVSTMVFLAGHFEPGILGALLIVFFALLFFYTADLTGSIAFSCGGHVAVNFFGALTTNNKANSATTMEDLAILGGSGLVWLLCIGLLRRWRSPVESPTALA